MKVARAFSASALCVLRAAEVLGKSLFFTVVWCVCVFVCECERADVRTLAHLGHVRLICLCVRMFTPLLLCVANAYVDKNVAVQQLCIVLTIIIIMSVC